MSKLGTRVFGSLKGCGADADIIKDADGIKHKIDGKRVGPKPPPDPITGKSTANSVSQMSFDNRTGNFKLLVALVEGEPKYNPNEADLKTTALDAYVATLPTLNTNVNDTLSALQQTIEARNIELYAPATGVFELQKAVKDYVRSISGTSSATYKNIAKIKFTDNH
jgi:hypothetical protein